MWRRTNPGPTILFPGPGCDAPRLPTRVTRVRRIACPFEVDHRPRSMTAALPSLLEFPLAAPPGAGEAIELVPGLNYSWNTLSLIYEKMGNYREAIKAAEKALETAPDPAKATYKKTIERLKAAERAKK